MLKVWLLHDPYMSGKKEFAPSILFCYSLCISSWIEIYMVTSNSGSALVPDVINSITVSACHCNILTRSFHRYSVGVNCYWILNISFTIMKIVDHDNLYIVLIFWIENTIILVVIIYNCYYICQNTFLSFISMWYRRARYFHVNLRWIENGKLA